MRSYVLFFCLVLTLLCSAFAFGWDVVYECNKTPTQADPAWQLREGNDAVGSIVPDPDVPGNNLLFVNDEGGTKIKWKIAWNANNSTGVTIVLRARMVSVIGSSPFLTMRDGGGRAEPAWTGADTLTLTRANLTCELDATAWHIYRFTTNDSDFYVYVDEEADPVVDGKGKLSASGDNEIYFGSANTTPSVVWYLDYLMFSVAGAYAPGEGPALPKTVIGGEQAVDFAGKLAARWGEIKR